jgi:poly(hydroxyalkanoate) granule-associated protein
VLAIRQRRSGSKGDVMGNEDQRRSRDEQADDFARTLQGSARQVWLAGLGALARAQEEGSKLFDALAREGASLQDRLDPHTQAQFARARSSVADMAARASERVEQAFQQRLSKALDRLDVPLGSEVDALTARVEALERAVAALATPSPGARRRGKSTGASAPPATDPE